MNQFANAIRHQTVVIRGADFNDLADCDWHRVGGVTFVQVAWAAWPTTASGVDGWYRVIYDNLPHRVPVDVESLPNYSYAMDVCEKWLQQNDKKHVIVIDVGTSVSAARRLLDIVTTCYNRYAHLHFKVLIPEAVFWHALDFTDGSKLIDRSIEWKKT